MKMIALMALVSFLIGCDSMNERVEDATGGSMGDGLTRLKNITIGPDDPLYYDSMEELLADICMQPKYKNNC